MSPSRIRSFAAPGRWLSLVSALLLISIAPAPAAAQPRERTLYVTAQDQQGVLVTALAPADLVVREDGNAREVLRVRPATTPLQIALLVDNSAAASRHVTNFREGLKAFVSKFRAPHELAVITLGDRPTIAAEYASGADAAARAIDRLFPQPGAGLYVLDGIAEVARGLQKRDAPRPVIVVVTTDGVEFSNLSYEPVLDAVKAAGAALHVVVIQENAGAPTRSDEMRYREIVFDRGPRESGGARQILLSSMALTTTLTALADELLGQFEAIYSRPAALIPPERVTVEAARPGLQVRGTLARPPQGDRP